MFAGDSKLCVEAINFKGGVASWQFLAVILDTVSLSIEFDFFCFNWVPPQVANQAPHVFGEWALENSFVRNVNAFTLISIFQGNSWMVTPVTICKRNAYISLC